MSAPKPSVCIILVRKLVKPQSGFNYQVLLAKRPENSRAFPGVHVFPGGIIEPNDSVAFWQKEMEKFSQYRYRSELLQFHDEQEFQRRISSIREVFEETNILLASCSSPFSHKLLSSDEKREAGWFVKYCLEKNAKPAIEKLVPFARWITPEAMKARFDTFFYLAPVDDSALEHMEMNEGEIESLDWISPFQAILQYQSGHIKLAPPTFVKLSEMICCKDYGDLMNPPEKDTFPPPVLPVLVSTGKGILQEGGTTIIRNAPLDDGSASEAAFQQISSLSSPSSSTTATSPSIYPAIVLPGDVDHPASSLPLSTSSSSSSPSSSIPSPFQSHQTVQPHHLRRMVKPGGPLQHFVSCPPNHPFLSNIHAKWLGSQTKL